MFFRRMEAGLLYFLVIINVVQKDVMQILLSLYIYISLYFIIILAK